MWQDPIKQLKHESRVAVYTGSPREKDLLNLIELCHEIIRKDYKAPLFDGVVTLFSRTGFDVLTSIPFGEVTYGLLVITIVPNSDKKIQDKSVRVYQVVHIPRASEVPGGIEGYTLAYIYGEEIKRNEYMLPMFTQAFESLSQSTETSEPAEAPPEPEEVMEMPSSFETPSSSIKSFKERQPLAESSLQQSDYPRLVVNYPICATTIDGRTGVLNEDMDLKYTVGHLICECNRTYICGFDPEINQIKAEFSQCKLIALERNYLFAPGNYVTTGVAAAENIKKPAILRLQYPRLQPFGTTRKTEIIDPYEYSVLHALFRNKLKFKNRDAPVPYPYTIPYFPGTPYLFDDIKDAIKNTINAWNEANTDENKNVERTYRDIYSHFMDAITAYVQWRSHYNLLRSRGEANLTNCVSHFAVSRNVEHYLDYNNYTKDPKRYNDIVLEFLEHMKDEWKRNRVDRREIRSVRSSKPIFYNIYDISHGLISYAEILFVKNFPPLIPDEAKRIIPIEWKHAVNDSERKRIYTGSAEEECRSLYEILKSPIGSNWESHVTFKSRLTIRIHEASSGDASKTVNTISKMEAETSRGRNFFIIVTDVDKANFLNVEGKKVDGVRIYQLVPLPHSFGLLFVYGTPLEVNDPILPCNGMDFFEGLGLLIPHENQHISKDRKLITTGPGNCKEFQSVNGVYIGATEILNPPCMLQLKSKDRIPQIAPELDEYEYSVWHAYFRNQLAYAMPRTKTRMSHFFDMLDDASLAPTSYRPYFTYSLNPYSYMPKLEKITRPFLSRPIKDKSSDIITDEEFTMELFSDNLNFTGTFPILAIFGSLLAKAQWKAHTLKKEGNYDQFKLFHDLQRILQEYTAVSQFDTKIQDILLLYLHEKWTGFPHVVQYGLAEYFAILTSRDNVDWDVIMSNVLNNLYAEHDQLSLCVFQDYIKYVPAIPGFELVIPSEYFNIGTSGWKTRAFTDSWNTTKLIVILVYSAMISTKTYNPTFLEHADELLNLLIDGRYPIVEDGSRFAYLHFGPPLAPEQSQSHEKVFFNAKMTLLTGILSEVKSRNEFIEKIITRLPANIHQFKSLLWIISRTLVAILLRLNSQSEQKKSLIKLYNVILSEFRNFITSKTDDSRNNLAHCIIYLAKQCRNCFRSMKSQFIGDEEFWRLAAFFEEIPNELFTSVADTEDIFPDATPITPKELEIFQVEAFLQPVYEAEKRHDEVEAMKKDAELLIKEEEKQKEADAKLIAELKGKDWREEIPLSQPKPKSDEEIAKELEKGHSEKDIEESQEENESGQPPKSKYQRLKVMFH